MNLASIWKSIAIAPLKVFVPAAWCENTRMKFRRNLFNDFWCFFFFLGLLVKRIVIDEIKKYN